MGGARGVACWLLLILSAADGLEIGLPPRLMPVSMLARTRMKSTCSSARSCPVSMMASAAAVEDEEDLCPGCTSRCSGCPWAPYDDLGGGDDDGDGEDDGGKDSPECSSGSSTALRLEVSDTARIKEA